MLALFDGELSLTQRDKVDNELIWQLTRDFMNRIIEDLAEKEREVGMVRDLVKTLRHLWLTVAFKGNLGLLHAALAEKNIAEAKRIYRQLTEAYLCYEIIGSTLYELNWGESAQLMKSRRLGTYTRLIELLSNLRDGDTEVTILNEPAARRSQFNRIGERGWIHAFILLANLWANAIKASPHVTITFRPTASRLGLVIANDGVMPPNVVQYLNRLSTERPAKGEGIQHIVTALDHLEHVRLHAVSGRRGTMVTLSLR